MNGKMNGFWRGQIVKHLPAGRVKVFVPGVYPDEFQDQPDRLPDAELASPLMAGGVGGSGVFSYPDVGSVVWCFFMDDDVNYPVVFAQTLGSRQAQIQYGKAASELKNGKPADAHIIKAGKSSVYLHEGGTVIIKNSKGGSMITLDKEGNVFVEGKWLQLTGENVKIEATQDLDLAGNAVKIWAREGGVQANSASTALVNANSVIVRTSSHNRIL